MSISREDFASTTQAKSDQMNAVDLVGGPVAYRITGIKMTGAPDQPVSISVDGHRQPWKPSKTFRRVLLLLWPETSPDEWVGRDVVLWCDPEIKWAGEKVGGIAISHASHINERKVFALAESKSKRKTIVVEPFQPVDAPAQSSAPVFWPDEAFAKRLAAAQPKIDSRELTAEAFIATLEKKAPMTAGQKARVKPTPATVIDDDEPPQYEGNAFDDMPE
jgi:hypothetical protein